MGHNYSMYHFTVVLLHRDWFTTMWQIMAIVMLTSRRCGELEDHSSQLLEAVCGAPHGSEPNCRVFGGNYISPRPESWP